LRHHPAGAGLGKGAGIGGLVIVHRVRIGHEQCRASDGGQFRGCRGPGAADHEMRAREAGRHIVEEALDLGGDGGGF
jgi:hypothetical protein